MSIRTDLVTERRRLHTEEIEGASYSERSIGDITVETIDIKTDVAAEKIGSQKGRYITLNLPPLQSTVISDAVHDAVVAALDEICPKCRQNVLVVGLGNVEITPDALGPLTAEQIFVTRHIGKTLAEGLGLGGLSNVSAICTGVVGKTGIESADTVSAVCGTVRPDFVIVIDALAAREPKRLCKTVQLSNTGIVSGSGVGNARRAINRQTLGVPVVSVGVPTVIDAATYRFDLGGGECEEELFVTPKDIDMLIRISAELLSDAINCVLHKSLDRETLKMLTK